MRLVVIFLLCVLSGCATYVQPKKKEIVKSFNVEKDYDKTWTSIVRVFADKNIIFKSMDKASGLITSEIVMFDPFGVEKNYIDCGNLGGGMQLANYNGQAIYSIFVEKEDNSSRVTINIKPIMKIQAGDVVNEKECFSTGLFEKEMFDKIK